MKSEIMSLTLALGLWNAPAVAAATEKQADSICAATAYGARGDARTLDTGAIQRAIDACAGRGGGVVLLAGGTFVSGTIVLKDHVTLRIAPGAVLLGSPRIEDYTPYPATDVPAIFVDGSTQNKGNGPYHLIHAEKARDVAVDGGGTIDGNDRAFWDSDPQRGWIARRARPSPLIETVDTVGVRIENVMIRHAPGWTIHPLESSDIRIRGVTIRNDGRGPNTDAIDIDSSSNVLISDVDIEAGDDCVVLKTTARRGRPTPPVRNVIVSGVICSSDDQGIKIGTESQGDFSDILIANALIYHAPAIYRAPTAGLSFSMVDGASFENLIVSNIVIRDAATPFFLRLGNRGRGQTKPVPGKLSGVQFANIVATGGSLASSITGIPGHPVRGVSLSNIDITMQGGGTAAPTSVPEAEGDYPHAPMFGPLPAAGLYARHVEGLSLKGVRFRNVAPDRRPDVLLEDVVDLDSDFAGSIRRVP
ncbi:glycoside hydrolase family 28 protein [Sphingomonas tabacisoli]|uniref:Glycoside hydrolase family 28 protein n=1 Tax=Sphingomonas tabacisoli TaxID=2249466 RepID=A0ABW4HZK1_9SPHN